MYTYCILAFQSHIDQPQNRNVILPLASGTHACDSVCVFVYVPVCENIHNRCNHYTDFYLFLDNFYMINLHNIAI